MITSMSRWLLVALGAAVVAVVALLLLELGGGGKEAERELVPAARPATTPAAPAPAPVRPAPAVQAEPPAAPLLTPEQLAIAGEEEHKMEVLLAGTVPQQIMKAAARCYRNEPGRTERMEVDYSLRFRSGVATLGEVELKSSKMNAPRLERCVVDTLRTLTWQDPEAPDLDREMTASISILDLRARAKKFGE